MPSVPADIDLLFLNPDVQIKHTLQLRSNFDNTWRNYACDNPHAAPAKEHFISDFTCGIKFDVNTISELDANNQFREGSEVRWQQTAKGLMNGVATTYSRYVWHGHLDKITHSIDRTDLHAFDPFKALSDFYFNFGDIEADSVKITSDINDPVNAIADPDINDGKGVTLVPITENDETRWVVPSKIGANSMYGDAYAGGVSDAAYSDTYTYDTGSFTFEAGSNRRAKKVFGKLYDTGMALTDSDPDILYTDENPIPNKYWQLGSDATTYIEFIGYTPIGIVYFEWEEDYIEGTNDLEQIFQKIVNPDVFGSVKPGATTSATILFAESPTDFYRDAIRVGATVTNLRSGNTATISKVYRHELITTSITGSWVADDGFKITDGVSKSPRWRDGVHFALTGAYNVRTIWPSFITINKITWNMEDGSALDLLSHIKQEFCPPNYNYWWDHEYQMCRMQYCEILAANVDTPYYPNSYGRYKSPYNDDGADDQHTIDITKNGVYPRDNESFASIVTYKGVYEHPTSVIRSANQIVLMPPGQAIAGWVHHADVFDEAWTAINEFDDHSNQAYPGPRGNLIDTNFDTVAGFEYPLGTYRGKKFAPFAAVDLLQLMQIGTLRFWGMNSVRPYKFGVRVEICSVDGILTASGEKYINPDADWAIVHPDLYEKELTPYGEITIKDGWLSNFGRYLRFSMRHAKDHSEKWCRIGLSEIYVSRKNAVYGEARIADLTGWVAELATNGSPSTTILQNSVVPFLTNGVEIGDVVTHVASGQQKLVTAVNSETELVTVALTGGVDWSVGDAFSITKQTGGWVTYLPTTTDDGLALVHLPILTRQLAVAPTGSEIIVGHKQFMQSDDSLSNSKACMRRAQEVLIEKIRKYIIVGVACRWHGYLQQWQTVILYDPITGFNFPALIERIDYSGNVNGGTITFDASFWSASAWTGETPMALAA